MDKELQKDFMNKNKFRNNFLKIKSIEDKQAYNAQSNKFVKLLKKTLENFCSNLDGKHVTDNKKFGETVESFFSDKNKQFRKYLTSRKQFSRYRQ